MCLMNLPKDKEIIHHESNGGVKTPLNGLITMHENEIDKKMDEPNAWDAMGLYLTPGPQGGFSLKMSWCHSVITCTN